MTNVQKLLAAQVEKDDLIIYQLVESGLSLRVTADLLGVNHTLCQRSYNKVKAKVEVLFK